MQTDFSGDRCRAVTSYAKNLTTDLFPSATRIGISLAVNELSVHLYCSWPFYAATLYNDTLWTWQNETSDKWQMQPRSHTINIATVTCCSPTCRKSVRMTSCASEARWTLCRWSRRAREARDAASALVWRSAVAQSTHTPNWSREYTQCWTRFLCLQHENAIAKRNSIR